MLTSGYFPPLPPYESGKFRRINGLYDLWDPENISEIFFFCDLLKYLQMIRNIRDDNREHIYMSVYVYTGVAITWEIFNMADVKPNVSREKTPHKKKNVPTTQISRGRRAIEPRARGHHRDCLTFLFFGW